MKPQVELTKLTETQKLYYQRENDFALLPGSVVSSQMSQLTPSYHIQHFLHSDFPFGIL